MEKTKHGLFVFRPKKTLIWRRHCSIDQSCCSMTSKQFLESSSGMKFVYPSVRLANQKPGAFVSVRYTKQIALFPFVCCFCFVRAFSFQGHTKIALVVIKVVQTPINVSETVWSVCSIFIYCKVKFLYTCISIWLPTVSVLTCYAST